MPSLKSESAVDPILPTNMGDVLANLLEDEDCQCIAMYQTGQSGLIELTDVQKFHVAADNTL